MTYKTADPRRLKHKRYKYQDHKSSLVTGEKFSAICARVLSHYGEPWGDRDADTDAVLYSLKQKDFEEVVKLFLEEIILVIESEGVGIGAGPAAISKIMKRFSILRDKDKERRKLYGTMPHEVLIPDVEDELEEFFGGKA